MPCLTGTFLEVVCEFHSAPPTILPPQLFSFGNFITYELYPTFLRWRKLLAKACQMSEELCWGLTSSRPLLLYPLRLSPYPSNLIFLFFSSTTFLNSPNISSPFSSVSMSAICTEQCSWWSTLQFLQLMPVFSDFFLVSAVYDMMHLNWSTFSNTWLPTIILPCSHKFRLVYVSFHP